MQKRRKKFKKKKKPLLSINNYNIYPRFFVIIFSLIAIILLLNIFVNKENKAVETMALVDDSSNEDIDSSLVENSTSQFSDIYYYVKDNESRYEEYKKKNSDLSNEDVVWMVNQNLDCEFYSTINIIEDVDSELVLVNKYNKLPDDFVPKNLEQVGGGQYLVHDAKEAFYEMQASAKSEGLQIAAVSGYRSIAAQNELYQKYVEEDSQSNADTYSAKPGCSEHNTGLALDIADPSGSILAFENTDESKWIEENAYKFGFIIRFTEGYESITGYMYEPWHLRYIGKEAANDMKEKGINTYEEYYEKYVKNKV